MVTFKQLCIEEQQQGRKMMAHMLLHTTGRCNLGRAGAPAMVWELTH